MARTDSSISISNIFKSKAGSFSQVGTATTTFTVTIGATLTNNTYIVSHPAGLNLLSSAQCYISNKTTTTFDVVFLSGLTGAVAFDWIIFYN